MQFSLKTLVAMLIFACLLIGFSIISIQQRDEIFELKVQLDGRKEFSERIDFFYSTYAKLKAE